MRLLIILVCILCADVEHEWVENWRHSFSPQYVCPTVRYAILDSILQLARSPDAKPDLDLWDPIEAWKAFLRPILPQDHPCLRTRSPRPFQSSNIWQIQSVLDSLKYSTDTASILELNGRLRQILSPELIVVPDISIALSLSPGTEFLSQCQELQSFLGPGIDDECMTIIAYSKCGWGSEFLHRWSGTLEAAVIRRHLNCFFWVRDNKLRSPFLKGTNDGEQLLVVDLIVVFLRRHFL